MVPRHWRASWRHRSHAFAREIETVSGLAAETATGRFSQLRSRQLERRARLIHGGEHDRPAPHALHVIQHLAATLEIQTAPVDGIVMREFQRTVVADVA